MKKLSLILIFPFIVACGPPTEMNVETAKAFQQCLDKDWKPSYFSNGGQITFRCSPKIEPVPMNEKVSANFQSCLDKDMKAIYTADNGSFYCVKHGEPLKVRKAD